MELDEIEARFYGSDSVDILSQTFQEIALSRPQLSPGQLSKRALNETVAFIASTLQRCRDFKGHTSSLSREAKKQGFLERIEELNLQAPVVQSLVSSTPPRQILAGDSQVNPKYSGRSHDSAIASFTESDIDMNLPLKPEQDCSSLGKAAVSPARHVTLFRWPNDKFDKTNFGMHAVPTFKPRIFSQNHSGTSVDSLRPATRSSQTSTTPCFCQGICSWCHTTEYEPLKVQVSQWPKDYSSRLNAPGTGVDAYPCAEVNDGENPPAWTSCRDLYDAQREYWDQQSHDHVVSDVATETPTTKTSPPHHTYWDGHLASEKDDYSSAGEDAEVQYEQLVENIVNLVIKSEWIGYLEDDCAHILKHTHAYLENIRNHDDESETARSLPVSFTPPCAGGNDPGNKMGGQEAPVVANANRKRKQDASHGDRRRRGGDDDEHPDGNSPEDFDNPEDWAGDKKRARIHDCQKFPCPYRKRNPIRFNVRKHRECALNTFASMALLK